MPPHVFAYRHAPGVPPKIRIRGLPSFGHGHGEVRYRLIEDDEVAAELRDHNRRQDPSLFRVIPPEDLEDTLDSASDAVDAIEAGEHDDVLDMLLFAERKAFGSRVTVIDAIRDRHRELEEQHRAESDSSVSRLTPDDVAR